MERISFDSYNESEVLEDAVERYKARTGRYPERVLADKIYRNRDNLKYCKKYGILLSGPALGRPKKDAKEDKKSEYRDNANRIEVERAFSLSKRSYGLGLIRTKLEETTKGSIALSILTMNVDRLLKVSFYGKMCFLFSRLKVKICSRIPTEFSNIFYVTALSA